MKNTKDSIGGKIRIEMVMIKCGNRYYHVNKLPKILDFSDKLEVDLSGLDLSPVEKIIGPTKYCNLEASSNLPKILEFSNTQEVDFYYSNLSDVEKLIVSKKTTLYGLDDEYKNLIVYKEDMDSKIENMILKQKTKKNKIIKEKENTK